MSADADWHTADYPELRDAPPWVMEEMIAAEPALAAPILATRSAEGIGEAVRSAATAGQPVVVTGCGTSEHAAQAIADQLDEALRKVGLRGGLVEARQAFEAALDPWPGGALIAVSHEGATAPTVDAARAAAGLGAVTAAITAMPERALGQLADHVLGTPLLDRSWCHTVGYVSPILAGAAIAAALSDADLDAAQVEAHMRAAHDVRGAAVEVAGGLMGVKRLVVVGGGDDGVAARELVLKVEEGLHLPAAYRDLETLLHGHFSACDEQTGIVLVVAYRRGRRDRIERAAGLLAGARHLGVRTAAILAPEADAAYPAELTSAGRIVLPEAPSLPATLEAQLGTALALQLLTLELTHAAGINPDLIRREEAPYRRAVELSRPEGG
jgi:glucosamine--fructose-6-phosphate aminotransferase (isomerizing)